MLSHERVVASALSQNDTDRVVGAYEWTDILALP